MKQPPGLIRTIQSLVEILRGKPQVPASLADNKLLKVILHRRSIRAFTTQPVAEDVFTAILEAGRLAPSTVNLQSWTFAAFDNALWQQTFGHSIPFHASRAVIIISDPTRYRQVLDFPDCPLTEYTIGVMNASLAAMNMNLAAEALGISSVMLSETGRSGILDAKYLAETLCLPPGAVPLMTIVFGYARGAYPPMPPRLPMEQIVFHGSYRPADPAILQGWLEQMVAGYNASHLGSSFQNQLNLYQSKIGKAEADLREMIFSREKEG
ncbi:MAG TPA: nitroreductase family protein [Anaerolineales bacterium]